MSSDSGRVRVAGKFLRVNEQKFYVRGVTYGTFRPDASGVEFPTPEVVAGDFARMAANSINAIRTYTVPPIWLLDSASDHGLRVAAGIPIGRHIGYLAERNGSTDPADIVRAKVRETSGHPAILCYTIGNEIPAEIVRWHGRRRVVRYLKHLYTTAKTESPDALVTYVNYPSTEYLDLDFLDLVMFNVFLEQTDSLSAYLSRLQNIAGERPLLLSEVGLDSLRNGEDEQARSIDRQLRTAFSGGCAGAFVFSWTDEWHTGGYDVTDWRFGLTRTDRSEKPSLNAARRVFSAVPFPATPNPPRISVVVCSLNGADRIGECLEGIANLDYPDYETIVVDNGSTDGTGTVAAGHPVGVRVLRTSRTGLGDARNAGMEAATGEIVAYIDDDATPDPHWLAYLADTFNQDEFAGIGGPNIAPENGHFVSQCIKRAPGNPMHVLVSDREAEHIAGCNMAFRKDALVDIGGFDIRYRVAGDDVDVCWRMRDHGHRLGFSHAAMVWHRPRPTVSGFWRQQVGYGRAEALLEEKWPDRYNTTGQTRWAGRVYGVTIRPPWRQSPRVYHGIWGMAPFQGIYQRDGGSFSSLTASPEWYLVVLGLLALSLLSPLWTSLGLAFPLFLIAVGLTVAQALWSALDSPIDATWSRRRRARARLLIAMLHVLQPMARMWGRLQRGLTPWRRPQTTQIRFPFAKRDSFWSNEGRNRASWIEQIERNLTDVGLDVIRGGAFDRFDLQAGRGSFGAARTVVAIEQHDRDNQLLRSRVWPCIGLGWIGGALLAAALSVATALSGLTVAAIALGATGLVVVGLAATTGTRAATVLRRAVRAAAAESS